MRLLVTGAAGMLGQDVVSAAQRAGHDVLARSRGGLDVTDWPAVSEAVLAVRPEVVVNCAAWTDVDGAESAPEAAEAVNATGAGYVARAAAEAGAAVVHVSTDYVFDGTARRPYVESDPTGPMSAYGRGKLGGEREVARATDAHAIVRTAWLFGAGGRSFAGTMLGLGAERDEVRVVTDQVGCPTWTGHLAEAIVGVAERGERGILHAAGGGAPCSWHDFAVEIFRQAGVDCRVTETTSAEYVRPAPRPAYSVLGSERPQPATLPDWREGLAGFLAERDLPTARRQAAAR